MARWTSDMYPLLREFVKAQNGHYPFDLPDPDVVSQFDLQVAETQLEGLFQFAPDKPGAVRHLQDIMPYYKMHVWDTDKDEFVQLKCYGIPEEC